MFYTCHEVLLFFRAIILSAILSFRACVSFQPYECDLMRKGRSTMLSDDGEALNTHTLLCMGDLVAQLSVH